MNLRENFTEKSWIATIVILGFLAINAMFLVREMPAANKEILIGSVGALSTALGVIVNSVFRNSHADNQIANAVSNLSEKTPPSTVPPEQITPPELIDRTVPTFARELPPEPVLPTADRAPWEDS